MNTSIDNDDFADSERSSSSEDDENIYNSQSKRQKVFEDNFHDIPSENSSIELNDENIKVLKNHQTEKWKMFMEKYSVPEISSQSSSLQSSNIDEYAQTSSSSQNVNPQIKCQSLAMEYYSYKKFIKKKMESENLMKFESWLNTSHRVSSTSRKLNLRQFIVKYLKVDVDYVYIKLNSSCIKRDDQEWFWRKKCLLQLNFLRQYLSDDDIIYYIECYCYPVDAGDLVYFIEEVCKSNLKQCFEIRENKMKSDDECKLIIDKEWKLLEEKLSEMYICVYYTILYGPIDVFCD